VIWHNSTPNEVLNELSVDPAQGLSADEVEYRLKNFGKNELSNISKKSFLTFLVAEVTSNYSIALIAVAIIHLILTVFLSDFGALSSIVIIIVALLSTFITAFFKYYSEKELGRLRNSVGTSVTVIRNGIEVLVPATELVPGDIMVLKAGDYIRADARVIDSYVLKCDEFRVTGETVPSDKLHDTLFEDITPISKRENMIYSGSVVVNGKGTAVVTETADNTEIAKNANIALEIDKEITPLKSILLKTKRVTSLAVLISAFVIFFCGIIVNFSAPVSFAVTVVDHLLMALSVVVAAAMGFIPFILNSALLFSIKRLKRHGIMITDPAVAENLKDVKVICTDKTGALTTENLSLVKISDGQKDIDLALRNPDDSAATILRLALICTNFSHDEHTERHTNNMEYAIEAACIEHLRLSKKDVDGMYPKVAELPFDSERMLMTSVTVINGSPVAIVKGAPEVVLSRCDGLKDDSAKKAVNDYASQGLKVIAVAIKPLSEIPANPNAEELENGLTFAGILGFEDSVDPVAISQCKKCRESGIKIVMITGDHIDTAASIGIRLGIINDRSEALTGEELSEIEPEALESEIQKYSVFARISPEDKLKIVTALKARYDKVLVTGDSINDTPALLAADIGCALGMTASDAAKDASDLVVGDNRFYSIVHAVKESKRALLDVKKAVGHSITFISSLCIITIIGQFFSGTSPIGASAAMLLALFVYILPMIGFFSENYGGGVPFTNSSVAFFDIPFIIGISVTTLSTVIMTLIAGSVYGSGAAFAVLAMCIAVCAFCRAHSRLVISKHTLKSRALPLVLALILLVVLIITLTPLGGLLSIGNVSGGGWIMVLIASLISFVICEVLKIALKLISSRQ